MDNEQKENNAAPAAPANSKKSDYIRYILAAILLTLAVVFYIRDINKKQAMQAVQADINFIHYLVEENSVNSVDMIIDIENESKVNIMIPCSEEETKAITEALAIAEPTDFLEEKREGKLFTIFLNCNNNARFCIEAAVINEDPSNAYIRAKKPVNISEDEEKQEITWAYTSPAVIKGFGDFLNKLYTEKLPEIKRQSEFFQTALEKDENTKKLLEKSGENKLILSPVSAEQSEIISKQVETLKAQKELEAIPAAEPAPEAPTPAPAAEPAPEAPAPAAQENTGIIETAVNSVVDIASSVGDAAVSATAAVADVATTTVSATGDVVKSAVDAAGSIASTIVDAVTPSKESEEAPAAE
jgi:hypothetical protein